MFNLFKKIGTYLLFVLPWFLGGIIFQTDVSYYQQLNLPFYAPAPVVFVIIWPILYLLIGYSISQVYGNSNSNYKIYLVINYLANQLFGFCLFGLKNLFLAFVDTLIVLISSLYLYVETKTIDDKAAKYLIPYLLWNLFALVLIFHVFLLN